MTKTLAKPQSEPETQVDLREQLFNDGKIGKVKEISTQEDLITSLRGVLLDIDLCLLASSWLVPDPTITPAEFYSKNVAIWLTRHPVLCKAEVRCSGSGLHVLLMLDKPVELATEKDRTRWATRIEILQAILPTDPNAPGLRAMTRPVGSVNGKNGAKVELLQQGQGITIEELVTLTDQLVATPFKTIVAILAGRARLSPCPICTNEESSLGAGLQYGSCYSCGKVPLGRLLHSLYKTDKISTDTVEEVKHAD
jgi:hypothetical protein